VDDVAVQASHVTVDVVRQEVGHHFLGSIPRIMFRPSFMDIS
jgi:hypothetical protein